jgi:hypothetical protein
MLEKLLINATKNKFLVPVGSYTDPAYLELIDKHLSSNERAVLRKPV